MAPRNKCFAGKKPNQTGFGNTYIYMIAVAIFGNESGQIIRSIRIMYLSTPTWKSVGHHEKDPLQENKIAFILAAEM